MEVTLELMLVEDPNGGGLDLSLEGLARAVGAAVSVIEHRAPAHKPKQERTEREQMEAEDILNAELEEQDEIIRALEAENKSLYAQIDRLTGESEERP